MELASEIEEILQQEINILRLMLSNLKNEQSALINKNFSGIDQLIEQRLDYLENFEGLAFKLIASTRTSAERSEIEVPSELEFTHDKAVDLLKEITPVEDIELHSLLGQLEALFEEIDNQCNITNYFLQTNVSLKQAPLKVEQLKKIQLLVIDPDKEE